ncbi:hypothetical protein MLD38_031121 [Melastoma candidum]|uniref:Uncharacterized protein n=1 Tax=Melastoma candidum TaxID=119954 RepID=A0ACB9MNQ3_9MYRT|nr:hypothetical protein MLD38_031121 [Melastoma candidum]
MTKSVTEYTREFERLLLQCDVQEVQEQAIVRYLQGLKPQIADAVELQHYWTFNDVRALAHEVEQQQSRRSSTRPFVKAPPFNKGCSSQEKPSSTTSRKTVRPEVKSYEDVEEIEEYPNEGELLVIRKALSVAPVRE